MHKALLSTAEVASLFSVTETTVKRWADEGRLQCQKTPGRHRKFDPVHVMDFSTTYGLHPSGTLTASEHAGLDPTLEVAVLSRDFNQLTEHFLRHALSDDKSHLPAFFSYLYHHHIHTWEIFDLVIHSGMKQVGELWKNGGVSVGVEHRCSERTAEALSQLKSQIRMKPGNGYVALCACPDGTQHDLGLHCAAIALEADGWSVHYLGANTPFDSIADVFTRINPKLLCLSISAISLEPATNNELRKLYRIIKRTDSRLCIGGSGTSPDFFGSAECDRVLSSTKELLAFARQTIESPTGGRTNKRDRK